MLKKNNSKLLNPASAIESYFDNLLQEEGVETITTKPLHVKNNLLILPELEAELSSIEYIETQDEIVIPGMDSDRPDEKQSATVSQSCEQPLYSDRIKFPVQCLMFYVQDNQLSIPLIEMLSVVSKVENLTRLPQTPEWFLGILQHRDKKIKIADSAQLLSIHRLQDNITDHHILVLKDANWGITCDRLGEIIQLNEKDVQWSKSGSGGLALGTIKQSLAILLDPEKILYRLNNDTQQQYLENSDLRQAELKNCSKI